MTFDWLLVVELLMLGLATGYAAGLLGIGGGMLLVPFLTLILSNRGVAPDLAIKVAIATSMASILFTSIASVRAHHARGAVLWPVAISLVPGIVLGGLLASVGVFAVLKGTWLALFFAGFVGFSATQMLLDKKPKPGRALPQTPGRVAAGGAIGFLSGLVGAGGGFITVPFLAWCNVGLHNAVATSAAVGFPIAAINTIGYIASGQTVASLPAYSLGYVWTPALAVLACGSMLMAPVGARTAHALPVKTLKRVFALVLYALAAYMLFKGLSG